MFLWINNNKDYSQYLFNNTRSFSSEPSDYSLELSDGK